MTHLTGLLTSVRVVLVNTTLPANIGSVARAMHTMGLSDLVVVNPKRPIDASSVSHAAGGSDVLRAASVIDDLKPAVADCHLVFAASSRTRHLPRPVVTPTQAAQLILDMFADRQTTSAAASPPQVAVLFGREDRGLTNEELALADYHIQIEANPAYPVLNVAAAVQVIASFFFAQFAHHTQTDQSKKNTVKSNHVTLTRRQLWDEPPATKEYVYKLQRQLIKLMHRTQLVDSTEYDELRDLPSRLSRLLSRLQLDQKECEILTALAAKLNRKL